MSADTQPASFTLRVRLISDWHVGTGTGRPGSVDRLVARDAESLPFIPAKTLTGIWRDACEQVAHALDNGNEKGGWTSWVKVVFGDEPGRARQDDPVAGPPRPAVLSVRPAYFPKPLRAALGRRKGRENPYRAQLRQAITFVKPGVMIDRATGRAADDYLRSEEMARTGLVLDAACSLDRAGWEEPQCRAAAALLCAGARLVERLGGKRRRGGGRAEFAISGLADAAGWLEWLRHNAQPPACPEPPGAADAAAIAADAAAIAAADDAWHRLELKLHLDTPVVAPAGTVGNVVESLDHVPGTFLLPLVQRVFDELELDPSAVIAAGAVIALPATRDVVGQRGLPAPMALSQPKDNAGFGRAMPECGGRPNLFNRFRETWPDNIPERPVRGGYIAAPSPRRIPPHARPEMVLRTHGTIDELSQRPTTDVGGVFSYEALAAGQVLRSEIRLRADVVKALAGRDPAWWRRFNRAYRLGRSKKDDYGAVRVETVGAPHAFATPDRACESGATLTVWLVSDLLLRDPVALRPLPVAEALRCALEEALDVELTFPPQNDRTTRAAARRRRLDTWQASWDLPRPSLVAIEAGSCFRFAVAGTIAADRLARLEAAGLGERRAEGFGQVRFDDPLLTEPLKDWQPLPDECDEIAEPEPTVIAANADADAGAMLAAARVIERAAWRAEIARAATAIGVDPEGRKAALGIAAGRPGLSQLGALRAAAAHAQAPADLENFVRALRDTPRRVDEWREVLPKLKPLAAEHGTLWSTLRDAKAGGKFDPPQLTQDGRARLEQELWPEALVALVNACIRGRARDEQAEQEGSSEDRADAQAD
jgi:CRISPR-associated protein Csx10